MGNNGGYLKYINPFYWLDVIFGVINGVYTDLSNYTTYLSLLSHLKTLPEWSQRQLRASIFGKIVYVYNTPEELWYIDSTNESVLSNTNVSSPYPDVPNEIYADINTKIDPIVHGYFMNAGLYPYIGRVMISRINKPDTNAYLIEFYPKIEYLTSKNLLYTIIVGLLLWYQWDNIVNLCEYIAHNIKV